MKPVFESGSVRSFLRHNSDIVLINLILLAKILVFNARAGLGLGSIGMIFSSMAGLFILSSWIGMVTKRLRVVLLITYELIISISLLADSLYYRVFDRAIPFVVLHQSQQVSAIGTSVLSILNPYDFLFFVDLIIVVPYLFKLNSRKQETVKHVLGTVALVALGVMIITVNSLQLKSAYGKSTLAASGGNIVLKNLGVLNYHCFDLLGNIISRPAGTSQQQLDGIKDYLEIKRLGPAAQFKGIAKEKNVIIIQLENLEEFVVGSRINGQEITPNLNKLMSSSMYFDNFYSQVQDGHTADAEFITLNSLFPLKAGTAYELKADNTFQSLPSVLKAGGYGTYAFHGYEPNFWNRANMYKAEGFDKFYSLESFVQDEKIGWGLGDMSFYRQSSVVLSQLKQPYLALMVSLSAHLPYIAPDYTKDLAIPQGEYSKDFEEYLYLQHYADKALGEFIQQLKDKDILDQSILMIYGDHFAVLEDKDIKHFVQNRTVTEDNLKFEKDHVPLFVRLPKGQGAGVKHIAAGQIDLYPTLANLLGLNTGNMVYFGQDLLNSKDGLVVFRDGSFITNDSLYKASLDGVFAEGKGMKLNTAEPLPVGKLAVCSQKARWLLNSSDLLLEENLIPRLLKSAKK